MEKYVLSCSHQIKKQIEIKLYNPVMKKQFRSLRRRVEKPSLENNAFSSCSVPLPYAQKQTEFSFPCVLHEVASEPLYGQFPLPEMLFLSFSLSFWLNSLGLLQASQS